MYIINVMEKFDRKKVYKCNKFIKDWLVYQKHLPILGQSKDGYWLFHRTENLEKALKELPLYLRLVDNLN